MGDVSTDDVAGNHKAMVNILCNVHEGVNIFHWNAGSLNGNKLDYIRHVFEHSAVDILCVSETWFVSGIPDITYSINGLKLFRHDRCAGKGGGVAIYCRSDFKATIISKSRDSGIEFINVVIADNNTKLFISCVYNPNRLTDFTPYFDDLSTLLLDYDHYVVCGDLNINLLKKDTLSDSLFDHVATAGLTIVNTVLPTRFADNATPTLLDLFIVSNVSNVVKFDQIGFISDHDLIFSNIDIPLKRSSETISYSYFNYKAINLASLEQDLCTTDWTGCWMGVSVDAKLQWLLSVISNLFLLHVPRKTVSAISNSTPWLTPSVLVLIKRRNILHSKWRNSPTSSNWLIFKRARNITNEAVKSAKRNYYCSKLCTKLSTKQLWTNIRNLRVVKKDVYGCSTDPDELNEYFAPNCSVESSCEFGDLITQHCEVMNPFQFHVVSEGDIAFHMARISSGAIGHDGIPLAFIKLILPHILPSLTHIINHCITSSVFPSQWKVAMVTPIAKKPNALAPCDYRPISILPVLSKVFEKIMAQQITEYLNSSQLLSPLQSGFRSGHSCNTAMLKIIEDIRDPYDSSQLTLLCLLDFSKAFDNVNHALLCFKLQEYFHFTVDTVKLIASYLSNRSQRVKVGDKLSGVRMLNTGVPQGSTLGPLLFSLYINDIFLSCKYANIHAFADDVQLYVSGSKDSVSALSNKLSEDLALLVKWAHSNFLKLNVQKCKILPIHRKGIDCSANLSVNIDAHTLECVKLVKNLGFFLNNKLTCIDHINSVTVKIYNILRILWRSAEFTPQATRRHLVLQLIMPHINYFCSVYSRLDSNSNYSLNLAFNYATRYVFGLRKFDHISGVSDSILGLGLNSYMDMRNLVFLHRVVVTGCPSYLCDKLSLCRSIRSRNIVIPKNCHLNASRFFFVNVIKLWNALPHTLKQISGLSTFRVALFNYLVSQK